LFLCYVLDGLRLDSDTKFAIWVPKIKAPHRNLLESVFKRPCQQ
jgi:hypothetical protein